MCNSVTWPSNNRPQKGSLNTKNYCTTLIGLQNIRTPSPAVITQSIFLSFLALLSVLLPRSPHFSPCPYDHGQSSDFFLAYSILCTWVSMGEMPDGQPQTKRRRFNNTTDLPTAPGTSRNLAKKHDTFTTYSHIITLVLLLDALRSSQTEFEAVFPTISGGQ